MSNGEAEELVFPDTPSQGLAEAKTIRQFKAIRDRAEARRQYARIMGLAPEVQNCATEIKLRAEREIGKRLGGLHLCGGDRRSRNADGRLKLRDLGISRKESSRWQQVAAIPDGVFQQYEDWAKTVGKLITPGGLLRFWHEHLACRRQMHAVRDAHSGSLPHRGHDSAGSQPEYTKTAEDAESLGNVLRHCRQAAELLDSASDEAITCSDSKTLRAARYFVAQAMKEMREHLEGSE